MRSDDETYSLGFELADITVKMPRLIENVELLEKGTSDRGSTDDSLGPETLEALHVILDGMKDWWSRWNADLHRLPARSSEVPADLAFEPLSSTFLRFSNLETASIFCRYHALSIMVLHSTARLLSTMSTDDYKMAHVCETSLDSPLSTSVPWRDKSRLGFDLKTHAKAIREALSYYTLPEYVYVRAPYLCFPARVAWEVLYHQSKEEAEWIEDLLEAMAQISGCAVVRHALCEIDQARVGCLEDERNM